jgi:hypothetical protein
MKTEKQEKRMNDKSHSRAETLTDLPVADEQAGEISGGSGGTSDRFDDLIVGASVNGHVK